jgi:hypothetical protein
MSTSQGAIKPMYSTHEFQAEYDLQGYEVFYEFLKFRHKNSCSGTLERLPSLHCYFKANIINSLLEKRFILVKSNQYNESSDNFLGFHIPYYFSNPTLLPIAHSPKENLLGTAHLLDQLFSSILLWIMFPTRAGRGRSPPDGHLSILGTQSNMAQN